MAGKIDAQDAPQFPLYIPSKGRSQYMMTSRALTMMGVPHYVIVEPQEVDAYTRACEGLLATVLPLDMSYKSHYQTLDGHGMTKGTGPGPARNFAWDHSIAAGHAWHWVMDDNIRTFYRLHQNLKFRMSTGAPFRAMEDFCLRYINVAMAGPNYEMFCPRRQATRPFITNTRVYSCNLIRNDVPFRWRGRYNEDTILSLDMLKASWATVQFNAFLQDKVRTQLLSGGNTAEFYHAEGDARATTTKDPYAAGGTVNKSKMLAQAHPDVARVVWKFSRWHHHVDYRPFKKIRLIKRAGQPEASGANEYGMRLQARKKGDGVRVKSKPPATTSPNSARSARRMPARS